VKGEIENDKQQVLDNLMVELVDSTSHFRLARKPVMRDGAFEFDAVAPGHYELRIMNAYGDLISREFVSIDLGSGLLVVRLPAETKSQPINGTVAVTRLQHPIPAKARREFLRSNQELRKGNIKASIEHLNRAVRIDPTYMEAYNNLGNGYIALNDYEQAITQFQAALRLDSSSVFAHTNLGVALFFLKRCTEAEAEERAAVRLAPNFLKAHYLLGLMLDAEGTDVREAVEHLNMSAKEISKARLVAARTLLRRGELSTAAAELQEYLSSPQAEDRAEVEGWLARLQQRAGSRETR